MAAIKLGFFDMEGTIFRRAVRLSDTEVPPSAWVAIAKHLGKKAYEEEMATQNRWRNGEYPNYITWMEDTIRIHKKYTLKKESFEKILLSIDFMPGAHEVFNTLHTAEIRTSLLTRGFKFQADRATKELEINHAFAACEYFWDNEGKLCHWNLLPADFSGKVRLLKSLSAELRLTRKELAFVGDGENDVDLAQQVGTSIAFNADDALRNVTTYSIDQEPGKEDLKAILPYLRL